LKKVEKVIILSGYIEREMAEWLKAAVLKTVDALRYPGVRIPLSLLEVCYNRKNFANYFFFLDEKGSAKLIPLSLQRAY
jgi:hypothetical protein